MLSLNHNEYFRSNQVVDSDGYPRHALATAMSAQEVV
jgi:hypothetical protein